MVGTAGADGSTHGYIQFNPVHNQFVPTEQLAEWAAATDYHIVKLHGVHPDLDELLRTGRTWVLYIYRDLRDVAVSRQRFRGEKRDGLLRALAKSEAQYYELRAHRDGHPESVLWHRYEDVMAHLTDAVQGVADLVGLTLPEGAAAGIAEASSVKAAKQSCDTQRAALVAKVQALRKEDPKLAARYLQAIGRGAGGQTLLQYDRESLLLYNHVSPDGGASGVWRQHLSLPVHDAVVAQHRDWLAAEGYLDAEPRDPHGATVSAGSGA